MDMDRVILELAEKGIQDIRLRDHGVWLEDQDRVVGDLSIDFIYREYWEGFLRRATIQASVAFDREGRLVMVDATKTVDAP